MIAAILKSAILNSDIIYKKNFTHSFSLNLMMAAILNSVMLDSDTAILDSNTLLSSLRFTQKHSSSTVTLTQTNSIWLTWWWQPSCILPSWFLPSWIQPFCTKLVQSEFKLNDSHITWWRQSSWILSPWIQPLSFSSQTHSHLPRLVPHYLHKKHFTHSFWLNLIMAAILNSAMLDSDTAILDSDTLLSSLRFTQKHSHSILTLTQTNSIQLTRWW